MSGVKANLCPTCPSRGLCVGEVSLQVEKISYGRGSYAGDGENKISYGSDGKLYDGAALVGVDEDGLRTVIANYTPDTYQVQRRRSTETMWTSPNGGNRSNRIYTALCSSPNQLLEAISVRADQCAGPHAERSHSGSAGNTYRYICRATAHPALNALVTKNKF